MSAKEITLDTYEALCKGKFKENDDAHKEIRKEIHGVRKLLWGLLVAIVLMIATVSITAVSSITSRKNQTEEIRIVVEEIFEHHNNK